MDDNKGTILTKLAELMHYELRPAELKAMGAALSDLSLEQVRAACARIYKEDRFFPVPGRIREVIGLDTKSLAITEWGNVIRQIRAAGHVYHPTLAPRTRAAVNAIGGWSRVVELDDYNGNAMRSDFIAAYNQTPTQVADDTHLIGAPPPPDNAKLLAPPDQASLVTADDLAEILKELSADKATKENDNEV